MEAVCSSSASRRSWSWSWPATPPELPEIQRFYPEIPCSSSASGRSWGWSQLGPRLLHPKKELLHAKMIVLWTRSNLSTVIHLKGDLARVFSKSDSNKFKMLRNFTILHQPCYVRGLPHFLRLCSIYLKYYVIFGVLQIYWVTQELPQICTVNFRICIGTVAWFAVYICGNFWVTQ